MSNHFINYLIRIIMHDHGLSHHLQYNTVQYYADWRCCVPGFSPSSIVTSIVACCRRGGGGGGGGWSVSCGNVM